MNKRDSDLRICKLRGCGHGDMAHVISRIGALPMCVSCSPEFEWHSFSTTDKLTKLHVAALRFEIEGGGWKSGDGEPYTIACDALAILDEMVK